MLILVLDDDPNRHDSFSQRFKNHSILHVCKASDAISLLNKLTFDLVCLDHDLDMCNDLDIETTGTGYDVARYIGNHLNNKPKKILIHSWNSGGVNDMLEELNHTNIEILIKEFSLNVDFGKTVLEFLETKC